MQHISGDSIPVMIVEDEFIPAQYLKNIIEQQGDFVVVSIVSSADEAWQYLHNNQPAIIFMDIMLEGSISGAELALQIHHRYREILIIFMTAYSSEEMISYAVESAAFAYLLKPYRPEEIKATLQLAKAQYRREMISLPQETIDLIDGFSYDMQTNRLYCGGQEVELSRKELELIRLLCKEKYTVVENQTIQLQMELSDASLRSIIYRIRKATCNELIQSVKRLGYKIAIQHIT